MSKQTNDLTLHGDLAVHCQKLEADRDRLKEQRNELLSALRDALPILERERYRYIDGRSNDANISKYRAALIAITKVIREGD